MAEKKKKTYKSPEEIIASPLSQLALKFKYETNNRKRDALFLKIAEHYMPKIKSYLINVQQHNIDEFIQIYYIEVYNALRAWKQASNFETYLYMYIKAVYRKFMNNIKIFKKDIDYCFISELSEDEEPTYENLELFYDANMTE